MAPRLPVLSYRKVERLLRDHGFEPVRQVGSHVTFKHIDGRLVVVPRHGNEPIRRGTLRSILHDAGIDPDTVRR